jgi:hypothetical protein
MPTSTLEGQIERAEAAADAVSEKSREVMRRVIAKATGSKFPRPQRSRKIILKFSFPLMAIGVIAGAWIARKINKD